MSQVVSKSCKKFLALDSCPDQGPCVHVNQYSNSVSSLNNLVNGQFLVILILCF